MTTLSDEQLLTHAERARGKVVVITGGMSGIGRETALLFASYGAKIVIGDWNISGEEKVAEEVRTAGGDAVICKCDVLEWDAQVAMFDAAIAKWGRVDIVVPCAGIAIEDPITFSGQLQRVGGRPIHPNLRTYDINGTGAMYTVHLALHYFNYDYNPGDQKALVMMGSMASWEAMPLSPLYSASKHAVLGLMRTLHLTLSNDPDMKHIRLAIVHPWFADTNLAPLAAKIFLAGIPLTPVSRIALAVLASAVDPDPSTSGSAWLLMDDGPVVRLEQEHMKEGVYDLLNARVARVNNLVSNVKLVRNTIRDLVALLRIIPRFSIMLVLILVVVLWKIFM